ncbi:MAG: ABC transporter ATP-binding protein [Thermodesulfobacteriota bacterium]
MTIAVEGLKFNYSHHPVLQGVSFHLPKSQVLAILGVNGAGKTTLLKCLNKILNPQKGSILVDGRDIRQMSRNDVAKILGYVPQRFPEESLTVFDAVLLGRKPYIRWAATERDYQVVEKVLKLMHLQELALRPLSELSGGEAQKVVIARALAQEPRLLLLDEPVSNLDLKNQIEVMSLIHQVVKTQELSVIMAIHDLNLALRYADLFLLLKDGRVHTFAGPEAITPQVINEVYGVKVTLQKFNGYPIVVVLDQDVERERS